eukprot:m.34880 g.34880  ORF g.34880 m.34880 type:complete len:240 (-) comp9824_c0_seq1:41-760(-)
MRFPSLVVLAFAMCAPSSHLVASVEVRVTVDCPRSRTITGMAEKAKAWSTFDTNLRNAIVNNCGLSDAGHDFIYSTVEAESATTFLVNVAEGENFLAFKECVEQFYADHNPLTVQRCDLVHACRTDDLEECKEPYTRRITSDGTQEKPLCSWVFACHWSQAVQKECAVALCQASGFATGSLVSVSNDMCSISFSDEENSRWYWVTDFEQYVDGAATYEAAVTADCTNFLSKHEFNNAVY